MEGFELEIYEVNCNYVCFMIMFEKYEEKLFVNFDLWKVGEKF